MVAVGIAALAILARPIRPHGPRIALLTRTMTKSTATRRSTRTVQLTAHSGTVGAPSVSRGQANTENHHRQRVDHVEGAGSTAIASIEMSRSRGNRTLAGAERAGGGSGMCRA